MEVVANIVKTDKLSESKREGHNNRALRSTYKENPQNIGAQKLFHLFACGCGKWLESCWEQGLSWLIFVK